MAEDIRDIIDDIRAGGTASIEGISEELNRLGILVDGETWSPSKVAGLMWMLDSSGTTPKNPPRN
jgi:hypothetical protein|tara:strand:- start:146 stop:340 length:195 start_codon:yes stop_codon:yes gene_type:complete